jgi:hypothetical protein
MDIMPLETTSLYLLIYPQQYQHGDDAKVHVEGFTNAT